MSLKNLQVWKLHSIPGQPFPMLDCLHMAKISSYIQDPHVEAHELFEHFLLADALQDLQGMAVAMAS